MKQMKKILALFLAVLMLVSTLPTVSAFAADGGTNCTVDINFIFENGEVAAQSYSGSFAKGSAYSANVAVPAVVGYAATAPVGYNTNAIDVTFTASSLSYSFEDIQSNITLNVVYVPALVNYTVKYYQQNVNDDNYTLVTTDTKTGYTKATVAEAYENLKNKYAGFYGLRFETPEIAADGSTVVEIYYDRDYYMMDFVLGDGAYGVDPIFARYGSAIPEIDEDAIVRPGYSFAGWDKTVPATMPAENTVFTAKWTAQDVGYTVVFWYENPDDDGYSYMAYTTATALAGSTVSSGSFRNTNFTGRDNTHFTYNADKAESKTLAGDGSTIINVYFTRNLYSLTFVDPASTATGRICGKEAHTHDSSCYGDEYVCGYEEHTTHTSACYSGVGASYSGGTSWSHDNGNGSLHYRNYYGYYIYLNGQWYRYTGERQNNNTVAVPTCHTHTDACKLICSKEEHTHTNACNGKLPVKVITAKYEADLVSYWPIVGDDGHVYTGQMWESSATGDKLVFKQKMGDENLTLTKFNRTGTTNYWYYYLEVIPGESTEGLTLRTNGGKTYYLYLSESAITSALTYDEDYFPITGYTRPSKNWSGTYNNFNGNPIYLYYTLNQNTLSYNDNYGTTTTASDKIYYGVKLGQSRNITPAYPSTLEAGAYEFAGWYTTPQCFEGTEVDFDTTTMPDSPLMVYAKWVPVSHEVTFRVTFTGTNVLSDQTVPHGSNAEMPEDPDNGRYEFVGWFYLEDGVEKAFSPNLRIAHDVNVYAKWRSNVLIDYRIEYELEDGTKLADDTTGSALAGNSKTFDAKGGDELYADYREGFFPTLKSHTVEMDIDAEGELVYTFIYVEADAVPYTVKYLDRATGDPVADEFTDEDNRKAVVTEYAKSVSGYLPEIFQQRLIVTPEGENVLIFYYNEDAVHAMVSRTHYTVTGSIVTEYSHNEETGTIGEEYDASPLSIENYVLDHITLNGEAVANDANLKRELTADGLIYEFFYKEVEVTINYEAEQGGSVSKESETLAIFSGVAEGSKAIPADGYRVAGWYTSGGAAAIGTTTLNSDGSLSFVPAKANGKNVAATYVAKFVKNEVVDKKIVVDYGLSVSIGIDSPAIFTGISAEAPTETGVLTGNLFGTEAVESDYGTLTLSNNKLVYTPTAMLDAAETFYYSAQVESGYYRYASVTVIPATAVYYEESFLKFSDEWTTVGEADTTAAQALEYVGSKTNVYGFDSANSACSTYSLGAAKKVTVDGDMEAWPTASFSFTGTGFDVISLTSNKTGFVKVEVFSVDESGEELLYTWAVDTYYGYSGVETDGFIKYSWKFGADEKWHINGQSIVTEAPAEDETNALPADPATGDTAVTYEPNYIWTTDSAEDNALYQIPVIKSYDELDYGSYKVVLTPAFSTFFVHNGSDSYDMYIDAIRIYGADQSAEALNAYKADKEAYPAYIEIREQLIEGKKVFDNVANETPGAVFIDAFGLSGTVSEFSGFGPNNEVYLKKNQAIAFQFSTKGSVRPASVQLGAKAPAGEVSFTVTCGEASKQITLKTATDMYYDITELISWNGSTSDTVIISNIGGAILSLTTIKAAYDTNPNPARLMMVSSPMMAGAAAKTVFNSYVADHTAAPLPAEEPEVTEPEEAPVLPETEEAPIEEAPVEETPAEEAPVIPETAEQQPAAPVTEPEKQTTEEPINIDPIVEEAPEDAEPIEAPTAPETAEQPTAPAEAPAEQEQPAPGFLATLLTTVSRAVTTIFKALGILFGLN